jgi:hypothetical protein
MSDQITTFPRKQTIDPNLSWIASSHSCWRCGREMWIVEIIRKWSTNIPLILLLSPVLRIWKSYSSVLNDAILLHLIDAESIYRNNLCHSRSFKCTRGSMTTGVPVMPELWGPVRRIKVPKGRNNGLSGYQKQVPSSPITSEHHTESSQSPSKKVQFQIGHVTRCPNAGHDSSTLSNSFLEWKLWYR